MKISEQLRSSKNLLNLPNLLSLFRIAMIPVVWLLLSFENNLTEGDWTFKLTPGRLAALIVVLAGITDLLDGYIARKWRIESLMGKFLDPVADKLFLLVGLVMLMQLDRIASWLVVLLLSRELLITALRGVAAGEGIIIAAGQGGKWKTAFQLGGLGMLMWYGEILGLKAYPIGLVILYIALGMSLISGYLYLRGFWAALQTKRYSSELSDEPDRQSV